MKFIEKFVRTWTIAALSVQAAVLIPCGLALLALAARIVWLFSAHIVADVIAAWIAFHGVMFVVGALAAFASAAPAKKRAAQKIPKRSRRREERDRRGSRSSASR
jgi:hypothetical protein